MRSSIASIRHDLKSLIADGAEDSTKALGNLLERRLSLLLLIEALIFES